MTPHRDRFPALDAGRILLIYLSEAISQAQDAGEMQHFCCLQNFIFNSVWLKYIFLQ